MSPNAEVAPILEVKNLSLWFGGFCALNDIAFDVPSGGVYAFIGPNGAGKTTLFNCIVGQLRPTTGSILLNGAELVGMPPHRRALAGLGRSFQVTNLFSALTVYENVRLAAQAQTGTGSLRMLRRKERLYDVDRRTEVALAQLNLLPHRWTAAGELSHGQQRRLEMAVALASDAPVLLLDEPTSGMGIDDLQIVTDIIAAIGRKRTVLLVEHNIKLVMSICDRITVMHRGEILTHGLPQDVARDPRVKSAYLGSFS
jgi:branched-chain amino acid transport system ATP-binding protein